MTTRKFTETTFFSIVAVTVLISLPATPSYGQEFAATDPPTAEKVTEPIVDQKAQQA